MPARSRNKTLDDESVIATSPRNLVSSPKSNKRIACGHLRSAPRVAGAMPAKPPARSGRHASSVLDPAAAGQNLLVGALAATLKTF